MTMGQLLFFAASGTTLFGIFVLATVLLSHRPSRELERMNELVEALRPERRIIGHREHFLSGLSDLLLSVRRKLGLHLSQRSQDDLQMAGFRRPYAADTFLIVKCLAPLAGIFAASFMTDNLFFWMVAFGAGGYVAPNLWLTSQVRSRRRRIQHSLPDAMDLLVICVDAGLGMDQALLRVNDELAISHQEIHEEFSRVHLEQRAGIQRLEAWKRMSERAQIPELNAFVSMLTQTERFGTPITRALSQFAEDLRNKRKQRAEEAAAKTKVKIVFPLVFCIFPCLFLVLLAPALLEITGVFQGVIPH
jgi:tight adherence protein C